LLARSLARSLAALGLASAEVRTAIHRYRDCRALVAVVVPSARARVDRRRGIFHSVIRLQGACIALLLCQTNKTNKQSIWWRKGKEKNTWKGTQFVGRKKKKKKQKKKQQKKKKKKVVTIPFFFSFFGSDFVKIEVAEVKEEEEKEKGKGKGVSSLVKVEWVFEEEQEEEEKRIVYVVVMGDHLLSWFVGVCFFSAQSLQAFYFWRAG